MYFMPATTCLSISVKRGARWWMTGSARAESTSGGTGVGPGVMRKRFCIVRPFGGMFGAGSCRLTFWMRM